MSARGDTLRKFIQSGRKEAAEEAALRAVILHNSDMISNAFRLKVLRKEIRRIEERMSDEGSNVDAKVRRNWRWSQELRQKARESESPGPVDGEDTS